MKKKILATMLLILILFSCFNLKTFAATEYTKTTYQIRPNFSGLKSKTAPEFWYNIRRMETSEGPMGLSMKEEYIYSGNDGNGLDVHMIKNTEWGVVAMLAMSGYGSGDSFSNYSTGNYTGVYNLGYDNNWEYTCTFVTKDGTSPDKSNANANELITDGIDNRYYDLYYVGGKSGEQSIDSGSQRNTLFYRYNYKGANEGGTLIDHKGDAFYEVSNIFTGTRYV